MSNLVSIKKFTFLQQSDFKLLPEEERLEITLKTSVPRNGTYEDDLFVTIEFFGSMTDRIVGLYRSEYQNEEGRR